MAKPTYAVPASIDRSFLDHEITLSGGGINFRPSPIKQLLFFAAGLLFILWMVSQSWISKAGLGLQVVFVIWALIVVVYLGGLTRTRELRIKTVPALLAYVPRQARHVITRRTANPSGFYSITGIDDIEDDGRIHFADGSLGQSYLVVGSASYLLFDQDRIDILNRVDAFWRKTEPTAEFIVITTKEPQRIYHQISSLERRNRSLEPRDPDLLELQNEQYDILTQFVGGKFTSIHQYIVLKAKSLDALRRAHNVLQAEVEGSSLMVKEATMLDREETYQMFGVFYQGTEDDPLSLSQFLTPGASPGVRSDESSARATHQTTEEQATWA